MDIIKVELDVVRPLLASFLKKILKVDVKFEIEDATKIVWSEDFYEYDIEFQIESKSKTYIEKIYDIDCVYLRNDLRNNVKGTYIVDLGCFFENGKYEKYFTHYDRNEEAWKLYQSIYGDRIKRIENTDYARMLYGENNIIEVSGDCCFNFNVKKYKYFEDTIIKGTIDEDTLNRMNELGVNEDDYRTYLLRLLRFCKMFHHSPTNIALMPKTGKMNNKKQQIANDRFDSFLWSLELLYTGCDAIILTGDDKVFVDNRNELEKCLLACGNVYNYCDLFCKGLDRKIINKIISSGKMAINTPIRVHEYLNLAYEFWKMREEFYLKENNEISELYKTSIKRHLFIEYVTARDERYEQVLEKTL